MNNNIKQVAEEILAALQKRMAAMEEADEATDWLAILQAIGDLLARLIEVWATNCPDGGPFSRLAKNVGFRGGLRFRLEARQILWDHRLTGKVRTSDLFATFRGVAKEKSDTALDDLAKEPQRPDFGAL